MIKRWRTIPVALKEIKKLDPECAITEYALRNMAADGTIHHIRNGKNYLVDLNEILGLVEEKQ